MNLLRTLDDALARAGERARHLVSAHPRGMAASVMLGLAGFGATAFGTASMAPDAADLPRRIVTENLPLGGIRAQLDALADQDLQLYRSDLTRAGDTADTLLRRLNVSDLDAARFLRTDPVARRLLDGRAGKQVRVETDGQGALTELVARGAPDDARLAPTSFARLTVRRLPGASSSFSSKIETVALATQVRLGSGTVRGTLYAATDDARIPDYVATQLTEVFATDIDFHHQVLRGDTFSVLYEAPTADGEPITWGPSSAGRVLAADYLHAGRRFSAVWFQDGSSQGGYFGFDGRTKKRAFLSSPMAFSRVTSGFEMRMHPILDTWRQHKGIDFGAPTGTPIRSVGDGTVEFAGWQNGYGNVVEILHGARRSTVYAHLSRIDVTRGAHVAQGQLIGEVGMTGWATGPHVHFELRVDGVQQDPSLITQSNETLALSAPQRVRFAALATGLKSQLEVAGQLARSGRVAAE